MKPPPPEDPEFDQVRELLRAQYVELRPKGPSWASLLARRFQPPPEESDWAVHAVPEVQVDAPRRTVEPRVKPPTSVSQAIPATPVAEAFGAEDLRQLSALVQALETLSRRPLSELLDA